MAHQYDDIDIKILWKVLQQSIPEMLTKIKPLL